MPTRTSLPRLRELDRGQRIDQLDLGLSDEMTKLLIQKGIRSTVSLFEILSNEVEAFAVDFDLSSECVEKLSASLQEVCGDSFMDDHHRASLAALDCPVDSYDPDIVDSDENLVDSNALSLMSGFEAEPAEQADLLSHGLPIKNQRKRGTCASFATVRAYELYTIKGGRAEHPFDLSEHFLHWNTKDRFCPNRNSAGTNVKHTLLTLSALGVCPEDMCLYEHAASDQEHKGSKPSEDAFKEALNLKYSGASIAINGDDLAALKRAITNGSPVVFSMPVFLSWWQDMQVRDTGIIYSKPKDVIKGGHAVLLVGFVEDTESPDDSYFIFDNSWGDEWAASGYYGRGRGLLPFNYVREHCQHKKAYILS